jgi:hypothetical protein
MASRVGTSPWLLLQLAVARIERTTLIALAICAAAIGAQWLVRPQIEQRTLATERMLASMPSDQRLDDRQSLAARHHAFRDRLADPADREEILKAIFAQAAAAGIALPQGDYSVADDADGAYRKIQIILPIKGSYQQIRSLTASLLQQTPALAMDEISFRRDTVKSPGVEATLRLTLYLKSEG